MTLPDLTYTIIATLTLAILALRYYRHTRQERNSFRRPPHSPPGPP